MSKDAKAFQEAILPFEGAMPHVFDEPDNQSKTNKRPHHLQHRQRLRERFMRDFGQSMADYELLELILFNAFRNGDVKPLAKDILSHFGDINHAISATPRELCKIKGVGQQTAIQIKIIEAVAHRLAQSRILDKEIISSWEALIDYCETKMSHLPTEQFRVLFLDNKNVLIADEAQQRGTINHVPVYPREVVKRALELNTAAIILVHNHPSGDPEPSQADIHMTNRIMEAASAVEIEVHDHVIIGKGQHFSFRSANLI